MPNDAPIASPTPVAAEVSPRDAALAAAEDFHRPEGEAKPVVKVEPAKGEDDKELPSSFVAKLVRKEQALKSKYDAVEKSLAEREAKVKGLEGGALTEESVLKLASESPVELAQKMAAKLDAKALKTLASLFHHLSTPEAERKPEFKAWMERVQGQSGIKSIAESGITEAAKVRKEFEEYKAAQEAKAAKTANDAKLAEYMGSLTSAIPEQFELTRDVLEARPQAIEEDFLAITEELIKENAGNPDFEIDPLVIYDRYEKHLQAEFAFLLKKRQQGTSEADPIKSNSAGVKSPSPSTVSNAAKTSPSTRVTASQSEEERRELAIQAANAAAAAW